MAKKTRVTPVDFDFGVRDIIPSTQEAYQQNRFKEKVRKEEKESLAMFRKTLDQKLDIRLAIDKQFPTIGEVFVFIVQYFSQESEYGRRDIDNMAKTVLDILKTKFYSDDSQVKTLLIGKKDGAARAPEFRLHRHQKIDRHPRRRRGEDFRPRTIGNLVSRTEKERLIITQRARNRNQNLLS